MANDRLAKYFAQLDAAARKSKIPVRAPDAVPARVAGNQVRIAHQSGLRFREEAEFAVREALIAGKCKGVVVTSVDTEAGWMISITARKPVFGLRWLGLCWPESYGTIYGSHQSNAKGCRYRIQLFWRGDWYYRSFTLLSQHLTKWAWY